jgi:hypothetical protein
MTFHLRRAWRTHRECLREQKDMCSKSISWQRLGLRHSRSQQRTDQRVLVLKLKFLARKKYFPKLFWLFFTFILCNFSVRMLQYFQTNFRFTFCPWKHKKQASKVAHNQPQTTARLPKPAQNWFFIFNINMSQDSSVSLYVVWEWV